MRFLRATAILTAALCAATPAFASPLPKADKNAKVNIEEMSKFACVVRLSPCLHFTHYYPYSMLTMAEIMPQATHP